MGRYFRKSAEVQAMRFTTNNERGDVNMNAVCAWINQGMPGTGAHCWHNGTSIFVVTKDNVVAADVGDWIVRETAGTVYPLSDSKFNEVFGSLPDYAEAGSA